jgi:endoglucanase
MLAGHVDEIGLIVNYIDDQGFIYFGTIGGWDSQVLVGQRVLIKGREGLIRGVIGKKAIHLMKQDERDKVSKVEDLWVDIGAKDKAEAEKLVRVGDPMVLDQDLRELRNGYIVSRGIDNRIGGYVVLEALRLLSKSRPKAEAYAVATVQEEVGLVGARMGAYGLDPKVAIAVDVTHATDSPTVEKKQLGEHKLGSGPAIARGAAINPVVFDMLVKAAEDEKIPYTLEANPSRTGTDADIIYMTRSGIPTGLVSIPNRYMHSPNEMVDLSDVENAYKLIAAFIRRLDDDTDFRPR